MKQPERRKKSGRDERPGDGGPQNGVTIVEQAVDALGVGVAAKGLVAEPVQPIDAGGLRLDIGGIARTDLSGEVEQFGAGRRIGRQIARLSADFGLHELLPEPFALGLGDGDLLVDPPDDLRVLGEGEQDGGGQVVATADDERRVAGGEQRQRGVRVRGLGMIDQHQADILARNLADDDAVALEQKLIEAHGEMRRFARDFDGAFDHGGGPAEDVPAGPSLATIAIRLAQATLV